MAADKSLKIVSLLMFFIIKNLKVEKYAIF